jgi:hypothetical protein
MPLLELSAERIAQELRRVEANAAAERAWRRRFAFTMVHAALWWGFGMFLLGASWHSTGTRAQAFLLAALFVGNVAPLVVLFAGWLREQAL